MKSHLHFVQTMILSITIVSIALFLLTAKSACAQANSTLKDSHKAAGQTAKGKIKIGFITSLSGVGGISGSGEEMVEGMQLLLDQIHHKMAGRDVELIVENDASSPAAAVAKFRKLVEQDKAQVIAGVLSSHIAYALAPQADKFQVPCVISVAVADDLTKRRRHDWVVRTSGCSSQIGLPFGDWVYTKLGYRRVAILGLDYAFGWEMAGSFQQGFENAGGKVVQKIWAPMGFTNFAPQLKALTGKADAVYLATGTSAAPLMLKQYYEFGPKLPVLGSGPAIDENGLTDAGKETIGAISAWTYSSTLDTPANKRFVAAYRAKYHSDPTNSSADSYLTGMWIQKAADTVKGNVEDERQFLAALKSVKIDDAPRGPIKLDAYGNPIENIYVREVQKVNGHLQNTVIHTFPNASQFSNYTPSEFMKQPNYSRDFPPCNNCIQ